ncbi:MAG: 50S ribosomal protein L19 [Cytophagales bacterium]|nr:50S ribosomal protein L19 [Cytophagales bacterium]
MNEAIRRFEQECRTKARKYPFFKGGDTIEVTCEYEESTKKTTQVFKGVVIQRRHPNTNGETFTVRKISDGVAIEKTFPILSQIITDIKIISLGKVRRARIFYIRHKKGKDSKIKTRFINKKNSNANATQGANDYAAAPVVKAAGGDGAAPAAGRNDK